MNAYSVVPQKAHKNQEKREKSIHFVLIVCLQKEEKSEFCGSKYSFLNKHLSKLIFSYF